jgi:hypothetical protein
MMQGRSLNHLPTVVDAKFHFPAFQLSPLSNSVVVTATISPSKHLPPCETTR